MYCFEKEVCPLVYVAFCLGHPNCSQLRDWGVSHLLRRKEEKPANPPAVAVAHASTETLGGTDCSASPTGSAYRSSSDEPPSSLCSRRRYRHKTSPFCHFFITATMNSSIVAICINFFIIWVAFFRWLESDHLSLLLFLRSKIEKSDAANRHKPRRNRLPFPPHCSCLSNTLSAPSLSRVWCKWSDWGRKCWRVTGKEDGTRCSI